MDNEMASNEMPTDGDIIEIEPIEDYNAQKARLRASLLWLLHKAYPDEIPADLREIFYETGEGHLHILPHLMNKLVSSDVYCLACASLFKDTAYQWQGHWSIIQVLSRKGIYVMETEEVAVTATVLVQTAPFRINAHLALIDALMTAYTSEVLSVQNVVQAVRKFTTFNASSDLPSTVEDAAVFWLNKVASTILQRQEEERKVQQQQLIQGETTQKVRITRKQLSPKEFPVIGPVKDLVEDCSDGCSLAAGISFYCPQHLKLNDICLKKCLGIADSLFNLRLVKTFCERHLPTRCFHFEYVDLLYSNKSLRMNILAFVAELFYWFELEKFHCVTDGTRPSTASRLAGTSTTIPISEVTRRSFHKVTDPSVSQLDPAHTASSPTSHLPPRQILLPKRVQDDSCVPEPHSSRQQTHTSGGRSAHQSILAWQDDSEPQQDRRAHRRGSNRSPQPTSAPVTSEHSPGLSDSQGSHLLANVSIDSEMMESYRSVDLEGLDESLNIEASGSPSVSPSVRTHKGSPGKEPINYDNVEILNISASGTSTQMSTQMGLRSSVHSPKGDPLLPARIKAAKEKGSNHSKAEERGDSSYKKQSHPVIKKGTFRVSPDAQTVVAQSGDSFVKVSSESSGSCPSEDMVVTPLPPEQLDDVPVPVPSHSYTIPDVVSTPQEAISAGIPVVSQSEVNGRMCSSNVDVRVRSRQSSVTSNRSSGEFSDHESQKIHLDHKSRESAMTKEMSPSRSTQQIDPRPDSLNVVKPIIIESGIHKSPIIMSDESKKLLGQTTNFAQIKKLRDDGQYDNSGYVFMQHGQESNGSGGNKMSLKAAFQRKQAESNKPDKRTTFATLPNQTTWQQSAQRLQSAGSSAQHPVENGDVAQPLSTELMQVRLKLEEKRRVIEREKHRMELQKSKQRQRLGKAAFMHVLSKKEGKENAIQEQGEATMTRSAEERVSPLPPGASSAMSTSQPAYSEPMSEINSSSGAGRPARSFSREGIQNTIENVRKKWFGDQNGDYSTSRADQSKPTASAVHEAKAEANIHRLSDATRPHGMQRATPPLDTRATPPLDARVTPPIDSRMTPPLQQDLSGGSTKAKILARMTPPLQSSSDPRQSPRQTPPLDRQSPPQHQAQPPRVSQTSPISISANTKKTSGKEGETYEEYNSSLDKLNNSLSELQGEIMRLSLKQERLKNSTNEPVGPVVPVPTVVRSGLKASVSPQPRITPPPANLWQQSHGISKPGIPTDAPGSYSSVTQPYTSPPAIHQQVNPQAPQSQFIMHGQPAGNYPTNTAFTSPNQYPPGGYIPGQQPPFNLQSPQMYPQLYQQSPPFGGQPGTAPFMMHMPPSAGLAGQPYLPPTAPGGQFQPPMSVPGYPQHPQYSGTYTVPSHTHPHPAPSSATTAVPQQRQQTFQDVPGRGSPYTVSHFQTNTQSLPEEPIPSGGNVRMEDSMPVTQRTEIQQPHLDTGTVVHSTPEGQTIPQEDVSSAGGNEGFFVSFGADTPKRSKPKLGSERVKDESAVRALSMDRPSTPKYNESYSISRGSNSPSPVVNSHNESSDHNTSGIGFVIGEDNTSIDKSLEDEMQRKREKMIQLQQKRRDEQERKRQEKELQDAERREKERRKQEEAELRKADEKARRDAIFQKYKERKAKDDQDEMEEVRPRKDRPRDRPRPKSMIVKTRTTVGQNGGGPVRAGNSHDDLHTSSNAAMSAPSPVPTGRITPKRGKLYRPASCHLMDTTDGDPRTAIPSSGSLTHRRPPSPDLYARFQNRKAMSARGTDSNSETGSAAGSDYAGPKLYVKPSQKSNRHIIVNAISHVCLAGTVNTDIKNKVLEEMSRSEAKHFLILFRSNGCQFRGLYTFDPETELSFKLTGAGPKQLTNKAIETFYKYNSGAKKFNVVASTKHISVSIDAVVAHNSVWKPAKQPASKR